MMQSEFTMPTAPAAQEDSLNVESAAALSSSKSLPSPRIAIHEDPSVTPEERPSIASHISAPAAPQYQSPLRHHKRTPSQHREVKETLNARSEYTNDDYDGSSKHQINQYVVREEIGRGSYGAVHRATDQFGQEYAVKEFSKARLRKRAQSHILKMPHGGRSNRQEIWTAHRQRLSSQNAAEARDALYLIREEIAIMKKLNHPNLVQLIEVLDDPEEDSLYMVLEMCKKGVIMKVGLDDHAADPYPEEACRYWFRDLMLGIEYLHAQGVVHRDIKPDNLLLTEDDVLKIVDFGVSEMFEKEGDMRTAKSAGSPAFLPPELCTAGHGDISGKAADIWSMGVSLYCLRFGTLPFKKDNVLDMYDAIRNEDVSLPENESEEFRDLIHRILSKDPNTRITIQELREHAWVTKNGTDPLLSAAENCEKIVEPPNELEVNHAFTRKMSHLLCVMRAISKFKGLIHSRQSTPATPRTSFLPDLVPTPTQRSTTQDSQMTGSTTAASTLTSSSTNATTATTMSTSDGTWEDETPTASKPGESSRSMSVAEEAAELVQQRKAFLAKASHPSKEQSSSTSLSALGDKGHAQEPASAPPTLLGIGTGGGDDFKNSEEFAGVVSDSPTGIDFDVYDRAFAAEVERIRSSPDRKGGRHRMTYLTRLVGETGKYKSDDYMVKDLSAEIPALATSTLNAAAKTLRDVGLANPRESTEKAAALINAKRDQWRDQQQESTESVKAFIGTAKAQGNRFADLVSQTMRDAKEKEPANSSSS